MPRWMKVLMIIVAVVALLVIAMMALGVSGGHGPSRHAASGGHYGTGDTGR